MKTKQKRKHIPSFVISNITLCQGFVQGIRKLMKI